MPVAIAGARSYAINSLRELARRMVGIPDLVLSLFGVLRPKKTRIRVAVLRDVDGRALLADDERGWIEDAVALLRDVFKSEANIQVLPAGDSLVTTPSEAAPAYALATRCGAGLLADGLRSPAAAYYRGLCQQGAITAIVVRQIQGKVGCSLGPLADYLLVSAHSVRPSGTGADANTLVHEMGHQNGLLHRGDRANLMFGTTERGLGLTRWQRAWIRNSRFVT
jgi:hypothetical protein